MIYNHIAVAVDESNTSLLALKHAASLSKVTGAKLSIITVINPTEFMALTPETMQQGNYQEAANTLGRKILENAKAVAQETITENISLELIISTQGPKDIAEKLVKKAESSGADLIVLGTHGRSGLMHLLMGSFAETVMRKSTLPLLIIRSRKDNKTNQEKK